MSPDKSSNEMIYQLKIKLLHIKPPIWRRVLVSSDANLFDLHKIIQIAMGWTNSHLHQFIVDGRYYSIPSDADWEPVVDERKFHLAEIAPESGSKFVYEYDFGDSWEHEVLVEKILPVDPNQVYPRCTTGKRACPPEDVGGVWGFAEFLTVMEDPEHESHEDYLEWWGEIFDPLELDLEDINEDLKQIDQIDWLGEVY